MLSRSRRQIDPFSAFFGHTEGFSFPALKDHTQMGGFTALNSNPEGTLSTLTRDLTLIQP